MRHGNTRGQLRLVDSKPRDPALEMRLDDPDIDLTTSLTISTELLEQLQHGSPSIAEAEQSVSEGLPIALLNDCTIEATPS